MQVCYFIQESEASPANARFSSIRAGAAKSRTGSPCISCMRNRQACRLIGEESCQRCHEKGIPCEQRLRPKGAALTSKATSSTSFSGSRTRNNGIPMYPNPRVISDTLSRHNRYNFRNQSYQGPNSDYSQTPISGHTNDSMYLKSSPITFEDALDSKPWQFVNHPLTPSTATELTAYNSMATFNLDASTSDIAADMAYSPSHLSVEYPSPNIVQSRYEPGRQSLWVGSSEDEMNNTAADSSTECHPDDASFNPFLWAEDGFDAK